MTPADGSDFVHAALPESVLRVREAILLAGGRALLLFETDGAPPPEHGRLAEGAGRSGWSAHVWRSSAAGAAWTGVALLDGVPAPGDLVVADGRPGQWRIGGTPRLDIAADPLGTFVRAAGAPAHAVHGFLLAAGVGADFARAFLTAAAEPDGFVEVIATPHTGGLMAQGWSRSLAAGPGLLAGTGVGTGVGTGAGTGAEAIAVETAHFGRDDILPPGRGFCCFGKFWSADDLAAAEAVFFEVEGRLLRLDVLRDAARLTGEEATAHVAHMLPRLEAPPATADAFRRICRPRYAGADTLSGTALPVAAAFDTLLAAPDGTLLATGWLLDPLHRVERVILKSTANLYAALDADWCLLPRPDLARGFGADPRFAGLLDERDAMHGFIVHAPAARAAVDAAELYLELVLDDGSCLFRPQAVTPFDSAERLPQLLATLSPRDPELARIVEGHLVPFLASVPPLPRRARPPRPVPLGRPGGAGDTTAIVPCRSFAEVQPILALLAGTPEAEALELCLVADRTVAAEMLPRLDDAFAFYGLAGRLVVAADRDGTAARLDLGAAVARRDRLLAWMPSALPKAPGWLDRLRAEADALPAPGLLSPALTYEDGSIAFGGRAAAAPTAAPGACALQGYGTAWLPRGRPRPTPTGAAEIALLDRETLRAAGGFAGRLFGDAFAHVDLADRLRARGSGPWCSGSVEFWVLEDAHPGETDPAAAVVARIDAALIAHRGAEHRGPGRAAGRRA